MTPAINLAKKEKIRHRIHSYEHDRQSDSYGTEAAEKLGLDLTRVFKTLVVTADDALALCVVPVSGQLDLKKAAQALKAKKCQMAETKSAERATGYVVGGISPLGQKRRLKTVIDISAKNYDTVYVSAGRRGLEIELSPEDLCALTCGQFAEIGKV